jgi:2-oxoglutarate dehydrogenase E1 component
MNVWKEFHGPNAGYVLDLYEQYRRDPESVDATSRALFERWDREGLEPHGAALADGASARTAVAVDVDVIIRSTNLAQAIRSYGHLEAQLDPLGSPPPGDPALDMSRYNLTAADLRRLPVSVVGGPIADTVTNGWEAIQALREIYCGRTGYDYAHIQKPEEREWLRDAAECGRYRPPDAPIDPQAMLERLTQVEVFEDFLHRFFPGKTRFSVQGLDMLVPILDEMVGGAAEQDICAILIGMAHRGRLNVLAHILNKPYAEILAEFKDPGSNLTMRNELGWTGDVKYHKGARRAVKGGDVIELVIGMPPNPSHLEHVNPVVAGMARAAGSVVDEPGPLQFYTRATLPILIHGDAAFPAQGVVAETLNLSRLPGYHVGGTVHVIANNQLGYTATPEEGYSTLYASDLAKGYKIPIMHVNADDPVACIEAARTAFAYRIRFEKDFMIDLVGYRRYGHNEGDEPSFTQPVMYEKIEAHASVREQWAAALEEQGLVETDEAEAVVQRQIETLKEILDQLEPQEVLVEPQLEPPPPGAARRVKTAVKAERLHALNEALLALPEGFNLHRKLQRAWDRRREIFDGDADAPTVDWATAEQLAFASILADGIAIRFTGEDVERGTFSQRHAVLHDAETGNRHIPLQALPQAESAFEIHNSPLSESAAVGFEYGYSIQAPERLVIWEAQYGDFINGAQVMIDEFVTSARAKWEQTPSLVLLLPHGYEGQGPDHSSGRMERFLQLAAEINVRLANCTTAAQYFHLLRRQAALLKEDPLPLIVFTPKSLLRHPRVASSLRDLSQGGWQPVIEDPEARAHPEQVRRLVLCSGKIYVDLVTNEQREELPEVAITRLEQLYRFPVDEVQAALEGYPALEEVLWVQEEPQNMGAWSFVRPRLWDLIDGRWPLHYIGRPRSSSPAEGSATWHKANQEQIVERAYEI